MPRDVPIEIWRGTNDPAVIWEFVSADGTPTNLTGSVFTLTVGWPVMLSGGQSGSVPPGTITHSSDLAVDVTASALVVDALAGRVTWPFTTAESQQVPRGVGPRYDLKRTIGGKTRTWVGGPVAVQSYLP